MMKKKIVTILIAFIVLIGFTGCATMGDVAKSKEKGTTKIYPVNVDQAWNIALTVFRWEGADTIEEHRDRGYMLTSSGVNLVSWGAVMGAWIEPVNNDKTQVTVVTKRRVSVNIATTLRESKFHERFAQAVDIIKNGEQLPVEPPD